MEHKLNDYANKDGRRHSLTFAHFHDAAHLLDRYSMRDIDKIVDTVFEPEWYTATLSKTQIIALKNEDFPPVQYKRLKEIIEKYNFTVTFDGVADCHQYIEEYGTRTSIKTQGDEVEYLIKFFLKHNLTHVDRIVVICSGRIEKAHADSIKALLQWLGYDSYERNFLFSRRNKQSVFYVRTSSYEAHLCSIKKYHITNNTRHKKDRGLHSTVESNDV